MKKLFSVLLLLVLSLSVASAAMARTVTADGTVISTGTVIVSSDVGGTVAEVFVSAGDAVTAGDVLVTLAPSRVYALQDGTVRLIRDRVTRVIAGVSAGQKALERILSC